MAVVEEKITLDDAAEELLESELALLNFRPRTQNSDEVQASLDNPASKPSHLEPEEEMQARDLIDLRKMDVPSPTSSNNPASKPSQLEPEEEMQARNLIDLGEMDVPSPSSSNNPASKPSQLEPEEEMQARNLIDLGEMDVPSPSSSTSRPGSVGRTARCRTGKRRVRAPGRHCCWQSARLNLSQMICSLTDTILKATESVVAHNHQMAETMLDFLQKQQQMQERMAHVLRRLDDKENLPHLEEQLNRMTVNVYAMLEAMGDSAPQLMD